MSNAIREAIKRCQPHYSDFFEDKRPCIFVCCGNCSEAEDTDDSNKRHCPSIYWPYNILHVNKFWFCCDFKIKRKFETTHRVDMGSRPKEQGLIARLTARGVRTMPAIISDHVTIG